jgi:hypothetical protein
VDHQRNPDIYNRLKVKILIQNIKLYQKSQLDHQERMHRSRLQELDFNINPGDDRMLEDPGKDGKIMKTLSFKRTGLKT